MPTDMTPNGRYYTPARQMMVPETNRNYIITLTNNTPASIILPRDVKFCLLEADGDDIYFSSAYTDGSTDDVPDKTGSASSRRHRVKNGGTFEHPQELKYNKINARRKSTEPGTAYLIVYPGHGVKNNINGAQVED